jgi:hypothetical protein
MIPHTLNLPCTAPRVLIVAMILNNDLAIFFFVFFCGAAAQFGPRPAHFWGLCITRRHAHPVGLLRTSDQLPTQYTTKTKDIHLCPQPDSNPRSPQSSGFRPTPWTAQPPAPVLLIMFDRCLNAFINSLLTNVTLSSIGGLLIATEGRDKLIYWRRPFYHFIFHKSIDLREVREQRSM